MKKTVCESTPSDPNDHTTYNDEDCGDDNAHDPDYVPVPDRPAHDPDYVPVPDCQAEEFAVDGKPRAGLGSLLASPVKKKYRRQIEQECRWKGKE